MSRTDGESLAKAFETTDYQVHTGTEWHTANIGQPCPEALRTWLAGHCAGPCAWLITAYNPGAERADATDNRHCDAALKAWLDSAGHHYTAANSVAQHGDWPAEPGVCVLDMDEGLARALALRFGQAAFVAVPVRGSVQLVWVNP